MAYITSIDKDSSGKPVMAPQDCVVGTTPRAITLNPDQIYTFVHEGVESDGTTASTVAIYLSFDGAAPNTGDVGANDDGNQCILLPSTAKAIGPGLSSVYVDVVSGEARMTIIPTEPQFRRW